MHPTASFGVVAAFLILPVLVGAVIVALVRRARPEWTGRAIAYVIQWLALTIAIASTGVFRRFDVRPPPMAILFLVVFVTGIALARSRIGAALSELPLWLLVIVQGFRLPLEIAMHSAASEGTMPQVMTWRSSGTPLGLNFDIVTGASALVLGIVLYRSTAKDAAKRVMVWIWLALSFVTLVTIVVVAFLASPMVMRFGPDQVNTWVTYPPFIWLPAVLVVTALAGQLITARALLRTRSSRGDQLFEKTTTPAQP